jgi:hypothetical protein
LDFFDFERDFCRFTNLAAAFFTFAADSFGAILRMFFSACF